MSWIDKINTNLTITTGDGAEFVPDWLNANKAIEYNTAKHTFKQLAGTLVDRGTPMGGSYNLDIIFQGEDHLDIAQSFEESAADPAAWTLTHPFYGAVLVQPLTLNIDNSVLNISRISVQVMETIGAGVLRPKISAPEKIADEKIVVDEALGESYEAALPESQVSSLQQLQGNVDSLYNNISKSIYDTVDFSGYLNKYNEVNALINGTVYDALALIGQVQNLVSFPAQFTKTIADRLAMFELQLSLLNAGATNLTSKADKTIYAVMAGTSITASILSAVTNIGTAYINRVDVVTVINTIYTMFSDYITTLDSLQTENGGQPDSFIPDINSTVQLQNLVVYAITALTDYANDGRLEMSIYLEEDSNPILLADRFYGLKEDDSTLDEFIATNNIGLIQNELIEIKKGRRLVYYVTKDRK